MVRYLLCLLVTTIVQVECFRVPLPYGTGYQGSTNQDDELSDQGIFHLLWHSSKAARGTIGSLQIIHKNPSFFPAPKKYFFFGIADNLSWLFC